MAGTRTVAVSSHDADRAADTATGHSPESLEGRVEAWRSVDAATGRSEKVNIPGSSQV